MISVEAHDSFEPQAWRNLVLALGGTPMHLPEILLVSANPRDVIYLLFKRGASIVGVAPALKLTSKFMRLVTTGKSIYLPIVPAPAEGESVARLCEALIDFARSGGYRSVEVDPRWGRNFSDEAALAPYLGRTLVEFTVDLRRDLDAIQQGMHKKHRKNLRMAQEHQLVIEEDNSRVGFMQLREMQQQSSERSAERGNNYAVQGEAYFQASYDAVYRSGPGNVLVAKEQGVPVAALAYLSFGSKAITVRSGSTPRGYETAAMYLVQFDLFRRLKEQGIEELNIGAVPADAVNSDNPQHGLYNYKRYYGGIERLCTGLSSSF